MHPRLCFLFFIEKIWQHISCIASVFFRPAFHNFNPMDLEGKLGQKPFFEPHLGIQFGLAVNFTAINGCRHVVTDLQLLFTLQ